MKYNYRFEYKEIIAHRWNRMKKNEMHGICCFQLAQMKTVNSQTDKQTDP